MVLKRHTTAAVAVTLALTASMASSATADPPAPASSEAAVTHSSVPVQPNPDEQRGGSMSPYSGPCSENCSGGAGSYGFTRQRAATPARRGASLPHNPLPLRVRVPGLDAAGTPAPAVVHVVAHSGAFHWEDAGIGAASAVMLLAIGVAGISTAKYGRRRHTGQQRAIAPN